jgi:hypothetical protein
MLQRKEMFWQGRNLCLGMSNDKHHGVAAKDFPISRHGEPQLPCMLLLFSVSCAMNTACKTCGWTGPRTNRGVPWKSCAICGGRCFMETSDMNSTCKDLEASLQRAHTEDEQCVLQLGVRGSDEEQWRIDVTRRRMMARQIFAKNRGMQLHCCLEK